MKFSNEFPIKRYIYTFMNESYMSGKSAFVTKIQTTYALLLHVMCPKITWK